MQWWLFAAMALFAFVWQARKEAQTEPSSPSSSDSPSERPPGSERRAGSRPKPTGDRVEEADRRAAAAAAANPEVPSARPPD